MTIIRKNITRPETYSLAACISGQRIRKPENPALEQATRKCLEERIKHRAKRLQNELHSRDIRRIANKASPKVPGLDKLIRSPPSLKRSPSVHGIFTGVLANLQKQAIPLSPVYPQQLCRNVPVSELAIFSPESTAIGNQKQALVKTNSVCMQPDFTCSQSSLSLSLGELMSPVDVSIGSPPTYMTAPQSFKNGAAKTTLLTPELLHFDYFSSYLTSEDLSGSIDDYLVDSAVFCPLFTKNLMKYHLKVVGALAPRA